MLTHARARYLDRSLTSVLRQRAAIGGASAWPHPLPLFVSQDGDDRGVRAVIDRARAAHSADLFHLRQPHELLPGVAARSYPAHLRPYAYVSAHYRRALGCLFDDLGYESVIVLEDDLEISVDFFEYFRVFGPLLHADESLLCVSAWNDHGKRWLALERDAVYRTDVFPGLGWMLVRRVWDELRPIWPAAFWDDWLRDPERRRGRASLRPEVNRAVTFGREGVSGGQFFDEHFAHMRLNDRQVTWRAAALADLGDRHTYDRRFRRLVGVARAVGPESLARTRSARLAPAIGPDACLEVADVGPTLEPRPTDVRVEYADSRDCARLCRAFGLHADAKAGAPRASYLGVVTFHCGPHRVFLAPRELG